MTHTTVIVAMDFDERRQARKLLAQLDPQTARIKVGKQMFTAFGPAWVDEIQTAGFDVFLDLKFHDIPNTVKKACRAAADLGVWMLNVHAQGGRRMLEAAREGVDSSSHNPHLIAVTLLTSLAESEITDVGLTPPLVDHVLRLASLTQAAGLDGVVCSAQEAHRIKSTCGQDFLTVCPGIQLEGGHTSTDQSRIMTPTRAVQAGADYLVIGRAITEADDPLACTQSIHHAIRNLQCG